jgi:Spy/CpxP family protein refolding chaperone
MRVIGKCYPNQKEKDVTRKLNTLLSAIVLMAVATTSVVFAQGASSTQSPHSQGMMGEQGTMQGMMKQMKPDQMKRMTEMMDKCNHMMDGTPTAGDGKRTSANEC